jgi:hypothetical protein
MERKTFYVNTWQRISLFIEPELLESIFSDCSVVTLNHHRGITTLEDRHAPYNLCSVYSGYLEAVLSNQIATSKERYDLYGAMIADSRSLSLDGTPEESVPVVNVRPETMIYVPERARIMTNVGAKDEVHFGIQLSFAKTGTYDFKTVLETAATPNGELFALLRKTIMARTKPCKFRSPSGIHRSSIRISDGIHARLKSHPMLAAHQLEVI